MPAKKQSSDAASQKIVIPGLSAEAALDEAMRHKSVASAKESKAKEAGKAKDKAKTKVKQPRAKKSPAAAKASFQRMISLLCVMRSLLLISERLIAVL